MNQRRVYLWLNVLDLLALSLIPGLGSPALLLVRPDRGDELLPGEYYHPQYLDQMYVVLRCSPARRAAIRGGLAALGRRRLGRRIRTRETQDPPGPPWQWVSQPACRAREAQQRTAVRDAAGGCLTRAKDPMERSKS